MLTSCKLNTQIYNLQYLSTFHKNPSHKHLTIFKVLVHGYENIKIKKEVHLDNLIPHPETICVYFMKGNKPLPDIGQF